MVERMMVVLGGIGRTASDDALHEIARAAEGAMRDALSILDVCLSYTDGEVDLATGARRTGHGGARASSLNFAAALLSKATRRGALLQIDELLRRGLDTQVFAREVAEHLRALLLAQTVGEAAEELLEVHARGRGSATANRRAAPCGNSCSASWSCSCAWSRT